MPTTESNLNLKFVNAAGIGFQIGVIGDAAFQFLKGLSASSSPKAVSGFHRLAGACKNVRLRPYSSIIGLVAGASSLHKANDELMGKIQNMRGHHKGICRNQTLKEWFCGSAHGTGTVFEMGLIVGSAFYLFKGVYKGIFSCHGRMFDAFLVNTLHVTSKIAAWAFLGNTLLYASTVALNDNKESLVYICEGVAAGLLSIRRGLHVAATVAALTGSVNFVIWDYLHRKSK
ncbi:hypothetical protein PIB30_023946 [Stylosanthes scabra]|uniref:Uncharacterized protein n=1 Tax=Stylosanthes scabra TaxID=79078 RepID=A0ABU6W815_9FABA|nr:hypothetical protein [Stylosanthes scabra]